MDFNFDKNLKIEIIEEAIAQNEIDLYRAIVLGGYIAEDFDIEVFEPNADLVTDLEIVKIFNKRNTLIVKLEDLKL
jgi:hypothetical protein